MASNRGSAQRPKPRCSSICTNVDQSFTKRLVSFPCHHLCSLPSQCLLPHRRHHRLPLQIQHLSATLFPMVSLSLPLTTSNLYLSPNLRYTTPRSKSTPCLAPSPILAVATHSPVAPGTPQTPSSIYSPSTGLHLHRQPQRLRRHRHCHHHLRCYHHLHHRHRSPYRHHHHHHFNPPVLIRTNPAPKSAASTPSAPA